MVLPINEKAFDKFIEESNIFVLAQSLLRQYFKNWYEDDPEQFMDCLRADFNTVMETYRFENAMVSFNKNFNFDPPLDTISAKITIYDSEGDYCFNYQAIFDHDLNAIDDMTFIR